MKPLIKTLILAGFALAVGGISPSLAAIEEGYDAREAAVPTTWYRLRDAAAMQADREYVSGMRPHHAGALTMSQDYLADPEGRNPVLRALATAIIRNQRFEIGLMDEITRNLDQAPILLPFGIALQPMATEGMAQIQRFIRSPIPGPVDALGRNPVTVRDVQFAKGMTIHHQAALQMARAYLGNSSARNGFLGLMNVDVMTDQTQEIAVMRAVISAYPGDPDLITVDPAMIHGMEGMGHGGPAPAHAHGAPAAGADPHAGHGATPTDDIHVAPVAPTGAGQTRRRATAVAPAAHLH